MRHNFATDFFTNSIRKDMQTLDNNNPQIVVMSRTEIEALLENVATRVARSNSDFDFPKDDKPMESDEGYMTRKEAAELLHVDFSTLWRWNKNGFLPARKVGPRKVMYRYSDVKKILNGEE